MDVKDIKDLILTIDKTSIESVEIEKSGLIIKINKRSSIEGSVVGKINDESTVNRPRVDTTNLVEQENNIIDLVDDESIYIVKSPMVGTFYGAPSPDSAPFVKAGDKVEKGQTLCIVEAMKMMNEIKSEYSGEILEILTSPEDIVEYGQPLMRIRR